MLFYISIRNLAQQNEKMFEYLLFFKKQKEIHTSFWGLEIKMDKKEFLQAQVGISRTIYFSKNRKKRKMQQDKLGTLVST